MFNAHVVCYPWDLIEEGMESVLDLLAGELGASGIVVPLSLGPITELRCHPNAHPRLFRSAGGCYYPLELNRYSGTRVKPLAADWAKGRHALEKLADCCKQRGLDLGIVLTAADFGRLASKYPEASTANLWGDRSTQRVCHLHGDVAELFRCMAVEVIERFSPSAVEWTGVFDTDGSASMANKVPANLGPAGFLLLNFCCCESCRQVGIRAGLDTNRIVRWMDERLTHALERGEPLVGRFEDWPDARPFLDWSAACREALRQVLESLRRASSCPMYVHVPGNARKTEESSFGGNDGSIWPGPRVWTHALSGSMEPAHPKADDHAQILAYDPLRPDGAWLVQALYSLAGAGFTSANLFHYGRVPVPHLAGIKQAIRFARRRDDAIRTPDASPGPAGV